MDDLQNQMPHGTAPLDSESLTVWADHSAVGLIYVGGQKNIACKGLNHSKSRELLRNALIPCLGLQKFGI